MTCTHAALKKRPELVDLGFKYDNILMEESAQILEIETFILQNPADGFSRLKCWLMIGDHHQLPPVIKNMAFQKYSNMEQSLFTKIVRLGVPTVDLDGHGRSRPSQDKLHQIATYLNLTPPPDLAESETWCRLDQEFLLELLDGNRNRSNALSPRSDVIDGRRRQASSERTSPVRELEKFEDETELLGGDGDGSKRQEEEEEGEGEKLFGDNMEADYHPMPALGRYDPDLLDDEDFDDMSPGTRAAAETELRRRDRETGGRRGLEYDEESEDDRVAPRRKRRMAEKAAEGELEDAEMVVSIENLEDTKGYTTKEWVSMLGPSTEIANRFRSFLRNYVNDQGQFVFRDRMRKMCESNLSSFIVEFPVLVSKEQILAYFLPEAPLEMLQIFDKVAKELVLNMFPQYERVSTEIHVRICDLPLVEDIRTFRKVHLNQLVRTKGIITATSAVMPQLSAIKFDCSKCGYILGPFSQHQNKEVDPGTCPECQSRGPFMVNMEQTVYRNYQKIVIQESPSRIPPGRVPRSKDCILLGDLCDRCKPGNEVDITAIDSNHYSGSLNTKNGFPVFSTILIANYVAVQDAKEIVQALTDEDIANISKLSKDKRILDRIGKSIGPSIYGLKKLEHSFCPCAVFITGQRPSAVCRTLCVRHSPILVIQNVIFNLSLRHTIFLIVWIVVQVGQVESNPGPQQDKISGAQKISPPDPNKKRKYNDDIAIKRQWKEKSMSKLQCLISLCRLECSVEKLYKYLLDLNLQMRLDDRTLIIIYEPINSEKKNINQYDRPIATAFDHCNKNEINVKIIYQDFILLPRVKRPQPIDSDSIMEVACGEHSIIQRMCLIYPYDEETLRSLKSAHYSIKNSNSHNTVKFVKLSCVDKLHYCNFSVLGMLSKACILKSRGLSITEQN